MKTINFFKTALLTIALFVCGNVGAEIAYNANFTNQTGATGTYSPNVTISLENQEWYASYCYFGSNEFRLGHKEVTGVVPSKFLPEQPQGASIEMQWDIENVTKISVKSEKSYGTTSAWYIFESIDHGSTWTQVATGTYAEGGTWEYATISPKASARYALVITGTSKPRVTLNTIVIEKESTSSVATPTFSPTPGKYTQAQDVTIDCVTPGASIYYTINESEPSEHSTLYNGAINISSTTTLKAIAINNGESSAVATATYTILTATPATIEDFLAAEESADVYYELTGTISNIANTIYGNFDLTDATGTVYVYGLTSTFQTSNDQSFASLNLTEGDLITIRGTRASFEGNAQVSGPAYFVSKTELPTLETPTANAATEITSTGFTANWNAVPNATSYEVNVWTEETFEFGVANSSFENGLDNWTAESGYAISTEQAHTGSQSIGFNVTSTQELKQTISNVTPGETITVTYWYYLDESTKGNGPRLWCTWEGNSDDKTLQAQEYSNTKGAWTEATMSTTVPAGATALNLEIRAYKNSNGYLDDITVTQTNASGTTVQTPIVGSPFIVTGSTNTAIINLAEETTYYYNVVAKADGYTASEASNMIEVKTWGEPTFTITGEGVIFDEAAGYTLDLGEVVLDEVKKEFTLTASYYNSPIEILPHARSLWKLAETAPMMDQYTFTPDENGSINAKLTVSFKTTEEMMGTTIEDLINIGMIAYGRPATEQWGIKTDNIINLNIQFTPVEEGPVTGLCDRPEMEGISFNGEEIINSLNLDVVVYNTIGQMVVRSNENINMSSYPAGVYVIKTANGASMKIVK